VLLRSRSASTRLRKWIRSAELESSLMAATNLLQTRVKMLRDVEVAKNRGSSPELRKLEVWVRHNPSEGERRLTLWVSSLGILSDRTILKHEQISLATEQASVKAFTEGRPLHLDLEDLRHRKAGKRASRWKSFFAVPIYDVNLTMYLGVVTLASTAPKDASSLPKKDTTGMIELIEDMIQIGRDILSTDPASRIRL
jgi:hypothetical protein